MKEIAGMVAEAVGVIILLLVILFGYLGFAYLIGGIAHVIGFVVDIVGFYKLVIVGTLILLYRKWDKYVNNERYCTNCRRMTPSDVENQHTFAEDGHIFFTKLFRCTKCAFEREWPPTRSP